MRRLLRGLIIKALITALLPSFALLPNRAVRPQKTVDIPLLEAAVRIARSHQSQSYLLGEIAVRYAVVGRLDRALELANSISSEAERDMAKAKIATTLKKSGNTEKASEVLDSIQLTAGAKIPRNNTFALGAIANEFAACGAFERVFELALFNGDPYVTRVALDAVLDNFGPNENNDTDFSVLSKVIRLSTRLDNGEDAMVIRRVAEKYAEVGEYEKAVRLADSLAEGGERAFNFHRNQAIENIAILLAKRGAFTRAIKLAQTTDDYAKEEALIAIAREQVAQARNEDGLQLLERVTSPLLREAYEEIDFDDAGIGSKRLAGAAVIYASAGYKDKAEELLSVALKRARRVGKLTERDHALREVAVSYAEAGMFEQAADTAQAANFTYFKIKPLADVAVVMLRQKRNREAQQIVEMIREALVTDRAESKADGLVEIAREYLTLGDNKSAAEVLAAAFDIARNAPVNDFQPITMWNVAVTLARADEYSKAIEVAAEIKSPFHQALALAEIGVFQARVGSTPHEQLYGPWRE